MKKVFWMMALSGLIALGAVNAQDQNRTNPATNTQQPNGAGNLNNQNTNPMNNATPPLKTDTFNTTNPTTLPPNPVNRMDTLSRPRR